MLNYVRLDPFFLIASVTALVIFNNLAIIIVYKLSKPANKSGINWKTNGRMAMVSEPFASKIHLQSTIYPFVFAGVWSSNPSGNTHDHEWRFIR